MKTVWQRTLLVAAVTLVACAMTLPARAQQADEDRAPATPRQPQSTTPPPSTEPRHPSSPSDQTQEALAFTGHVMKEQGQLVLKDPVTKMSYQLNDQARAKPYVGKQVKVTGKLEMKSNTIYIEGIEPLS